MRRLREAVVASAMELVMGIAMVAFGLALATAQQEEIATAGGMLGVLGGILTSWGITRSYVAESATEDLRSHLRSLERRLGTVSGQIGQAARDVQGG